MSEHINQLVFGVNLHLAQKAIAVNCSNVEVMVTTLWI
jgi:hypothetical protein